MVLGGLLVALVQLSVFEVKVGLVVLALILIFGGVTTVFFGMIRNIQRYI